LFQEGFAVASKEFRSRKSAAMHFDPHASVTVLAILRTKRDGPPGLPAGLLVSYRPNRRAMVRQPLPGAEGEKNLGDTPIRAHTLWITNQIAQVAAIL